MKREAKPFRFERHAIKRMLQRRVSRARVVATVLRPERTRLANRPGAKRYERRFGKSTVVVIAEEHTDHILIVSTWYA